MSIRPAARIDIDADLNMVDDYGRNYAALPADMSRIVVGATCAAGRSGFWSWVRVDEVTDTAVFFRELDDRENPAAYPRTGAGDVFFAIRVVKSHRFFWWPHYTHGMGHQIHWLNLVVILYPGGHS